MTPFRFRKFCLYCKQQNNKPVAESTAAQRTGGRVHVRGRSSHQTDEEKRLVPPAIRRIKNMREEENDLNQCASARLHLPWFFSRQLEIKLSQPITTTLGDALLRARRPNLRPGKQKHTRSQHWNMEHSNTKTHTHTHTHIPTRNWNALVCTTNDRL